MEKFNCVLLINIQVIKMSSSERNLDENQKPWSRFHLVILSTVFIIASCFMNVFDSEIDKICYQQRRGNFCEDFVLKKYSIIFFISTAVNVNFSGGKI